MSSTTRQGPGEASTEAQFKWMCIIPRHGSARTKIIDCFDEILNCEQMKDSVPYGTMMAMWVYGGANVHV